MKQQQQQQASTKVSFDTVQTEISAIDNLTNQVQEKVNQLKLLEGEIMRVLSDKDMTSVQAKMENITAEANALTADINNRLKYLGQQLATMPPTAEQAMGKNLFAAQSRRFLTTLTKYQEVQRRNRDACRDRFARHYRNVNPDATDEEITQKLQEGAVGNLFSSQALESSKAKQALKNADDRAKDIQRITVHILEINQLFLDVEAMVNQQSQLIDRIAVDTYQAQIGTEKATGQLESATMSAIGARQKRWIMFGIISTVVVIAVVVVVVLVLQHIPKQNWMYSKAE